MAYYGDQLAGPQLTSTGSALVYNIYTDTTEDGQPTTFMVRDQTSRPTIMLMPLRFRILEVHIDILLIRPKPHNKIILLISLKHSTFDRIPLRVVFRLRFLIVAHGL